MQMQVSDLQRALSCHGLLAEAAVVILSVIRCVNIAAAARCESTVLASSRLGSLASLRSSARRRVDALAEDEARNVPSSRRRAVNRAPPSSLHPLPCCRRRAVAIASSRRPRRRALAAEQ
mmetsp:Transcript_47542/g.140430  ORF Transcript_47542/g.140430 Transcript_47542/m.140430 type:complete len:120 (+) Transcript_47542:97-456(+)